MHRPSPQLLNKLQAVYRLLYGEPLEALEALAALATLEDLVGLGDPVVQGDQEAQEQRLLLQALYPQPLHQTTMTGSWEAYHNPTRETGNSQGHSSTNWSTTSEPTHESQD
jgi:hypothetical protein